MCICVCIYIIFLWELPVYVCMALVAQWVKNLPAKQEMQVWSLGQEDPLEEGKATHSIILSWTIPMDRGAWWDTVDKASKRWTWLKQLSTHAHQYVHTHIYTQGLSLLLRGKESTCNSGDTSLIPRLAWFPGEGSGNSLRYSYLGNSIERSLMGYSPWSHEESDMT